MAPNNSVYSIVTERITAQLEQGTIPWRKPWRSDGQDFPRNAVTNRPYHGVNVWLLTLYGYDDPRFCTYKQAALLGGTVKKGERGHIVVFWNITKKKERNQWGELVEKSRAILRYYTVFNVSQCEDLTLLKPLPAVATGTDAEFVSNMAAQSFVDGYPNRPRVHYGGDQPLYRPSTDEIHIPHKEKFDSANEFYATMFHEMTHSTGHESRLNRLDYEDGARHFGSYLYSKEELVAEFGSAFLCASSGIDNTLENSAAYIANWLEALKNDERLLIWAAAQAQKAVTYIINDTEDDGEVEAEQEVA